MKIIKNSIRCLKCNEIIESTYRHNFVECRCGSVAVDGGRDYIRTVWPSGDPKDWYEDLCVYEDQ